MTGRRTKTALLLSLVSLMLCIAMLAGTTFAWFTDTATSGSNRIVAGNLSVDLVKAPSYNGDYTVISKGKGNIFAAGENANETTTTLWEPGATHVAYLGVQNTGSLALKYNIYLNVTDGGLADVLEYAIVPFGKTPMEITNWLDVKNASGTNGIITGTVTSGNFLAAEGGCLDEVAKGTQKETDYFALVVHMSETAGNDYKNKDVTIDVQINATQKDAENDSFDNQYDKDYTAMSSFSHVTATISLNGEAVSELPKSMRNGDTITIVAAPEENYVLPDTVSVTGATGEWTKSTGTLVITKPTGELSVTIRALAIPTVTVTAATDLTYSGNEQALITAGSTTGGTLKYAVGTSAPADASNDWTESIPTKKDAGTYTVWYKSFGNDTYTSSVAASVSVEIAKANANPTVPTAKTGLTYNNGTAYDLVTAGANTNGKWQYKVGDGTYSETVPQATNAGTYTVYYKFVGNDGYNSVAEASFNVTISKATQTISAPTKASATSTSVTLSAASAGQGATKYGYNTTNTAPTTWQDDVNFNGLTANTTYYFFAKYVGNSNYAEAVSEGTKIQTQSACFAAGTKITMADGTFKNIENVQVGDSVMAYDVAKGEFYTTVVNKKWESSNTTIATVTLSDGTTVKCTPNHPLCSTEGWKSANPDFAGGLKEFPSTKLEIGDLIVTDHGTFAVSSIEINVGEEASVYNLSVISNGDENNNTFVANGVVAHNKWG